MAADSSFTQMLFFIAAIIVAVSVSGVLIATSTSMANELKVKSESMSNEVGTDIKIINDPRHVPYADNNLTLYIKNIGDVSLNYNNIAILIDGQYINATAVMSENAGPTWTVGKTIEFSADITLSPGDHQVKAVMPNGVSDSMAFRT
jgi:archaeal flagellar protein FlaG